MKETIEFRVRGSLVPEYLPEAKSRGRSLGDGFIYQLRIGADDPLVAKIGRVDGELRASGLGSLFHGWDIRREYSAQELREAELLSAHITNVFEPAGEECGTVYDDSKALADCGSGAPQLTELRLDGRRIPLSADFARTIAGEAVASVKVRELARTAGLEGAVFAPVLLANKAGARSERYFQLTTSAAAVEVDSAATRAGSDPFDESSSGRCPGGHVIGLRLLSEVTVKRSGVPEADFMETRQMVGIRQGLLRPRPILLLSQRAFRLISGEKLHGLRIEVAHLS